MRAHPQGTADVSRLRFGAAAVHPISWDRRAALPRGRDATPGWHGGEGDGELPLRCRGKVCVCGWLRVEGFSLLRGFHVLFLLCGDDDGDDGYFEIVLIIFL